MRAWRKQESPEAPAKQGVARAALAGASRSELTKAGLTYLLTNTEADRIGAWIETPETPTCSSRRPLAFRGGVDDRDGAATPAEWERLSPEAPLPVDLLSAGKTVQQDLDASPDRPLLGALVGMQRVLWVPVENKGRLRGVLLAGMHKKNNSDPQRMLEHVAAELSLALEWEDERRSAHERMTDLAATRSLLGELTSSGPTDAFLARIVESCMKGSSEGNGLGAVFSVLRAWGDDAFEMPGEAEPALKIWHSGDDAWSRTMESEPLVSIFRRAREAHCTIANVPGVRWSSNDVARIIAIPLESTGRPLGVLVSGFRSSQAAVAATQRLELHASLAACALELRSRDTEAASSGAQQQALLEVTGSATILTDARGRIAGMSRGAHDLLREIISDNRPAETISGGNEPSVSLRFEELFRARDQESVACWIRQMRNPQTAHTALDEPLEAELCNAVPVRLRGMVPPDGKLAAISLQPVAARDTARAEHAEAQLVNVIEWLEEGVVLFDADHGIRAMNTRFAQIAALAPEETSQITTLNALIARIASQAAQPEHFAERWREQARGSDAGVREEIQLLRPVPRVLERAARPITDSAGRRLGRVEIYRDLTAQRVFQSKLLQTEKLAALGQMVTGIAHELSNPLTSILGYAQRLLVATDSPRPTEIQQIFQEAERASTIVRQLLMTARDSRPERRRVDLNQVISRALDLQRFSLAAEHIRVEQILDPDLPPVLGDAGQLQQVLMNLIGNSRQAIEQGGKGGTVKLSTRLSAEGRVLLEVSDDGPGIPDAILSRIFDPFFTTKPAGIGTGLGLAIVLGIVREHGGQVHVTSPPSGGAIFTLEFPMARATEPRFPAVPATGPGTASREIARMRKALPPVALAPPPSLSAWAGKRVLVVEDEPTVARLIGDVLEDDGLRVDVLLDGREALKRAARETYDLVICDMKMPDLDGQHFYRSLVNTDNPLRKKFLFVTGDVIAPHTHEFLERHQLPHVAKPFRVEELSEKVRRVLASTGPPEPLPAAVEQTPVEKTNVARK